MLQDNKTQAKTRSNTPSVAKSKLLDRAGAMGSLACAIHCATWPILIALLPGAGVSLLASREVEWGFVVVATVLAAMSMQLSFKRHRHIRAKALLTLGVVGLWAGLLLPAIHDRVVWHAVVMTLGGMMVAFGHILTLRQNHGHIHDATCQH